MQQSTALVVIFAACPMALVIGDGCLGEGSVGLEEPSQKAAPEAKSGQSPTMATLRRRSTPPGSKQRVEERKRMVETQMARPRDGRPPVRSKVVLEAMRIVPRHVFVPYSLRRHAYRDRCKRPKDQRCHALLRAEERCLLTRTIPCRSYALRSPSPKLSLRLSPCDGMGSPRYTVCWLSPESLPRSRFTFTSTPRGLSSPRSCSWGGFSTISP